MVEWLCNQRGELFVASCTSSQSKAGVIGPTIHILPEYIIHKTRLVTSGLTHYPVARGHVTIICNDGKDLMSHVLSDFIEILALARWIAQGLCSTMDVRRCGLICDGQNVISLIPMHGLSQDWESVLHDKEEYHETYPGYLTTKNGPGIPDNVLDGIHSRITRTTGIEKPYDNQYHGDSSDQNLFAKIVRGELSQWRIWEDEAHIAFLTPFGNTPGYTVLVPRRHLSSDVFSLGSQDYQSMGKAAYQVAQHLKAAFGINRCGIAFEGFEINHAHIKLIPVHDQKGTDGLPFTEIAGPSVCQVVCGGYLTSQLGPLEFDRKQFRDVPLKLIKFLKFSQIRQVAPQSWQGYSSNAIQNRWHSSLEFLRSTILRETIKFFIHGVGFDHLSLVRMLGAAKDLGSESLPSYIYQYWQESYLPTHCSLR